MGSEVAGPAGLNPNTFRWDPDLAVLWAGVRSYPARFERESMRDRVPPDDPFWEQSPGFRMEMRHAWVHFENQWQLSTMWGDATYSSNRTTFTTERAPFIEEPTHVEVGVLLPFMLEVPEETYELPSGTVTMPARLHNLWGEPLGFVDVAMYHRVADLVMMLPTDIDLPDGEWDSPEGFCDLLITAGLERTL